MPKITAASVAEHRAAQHDALLTTAERLIGENDGAVPSLQDVATAMGMGRSSLYQYVSSRTDLLIQLLLRVIPSWTENIIDQVVAAGPDPRGRLDAYVAGTLELFLEGRHGPLMTAASHFPEAFADPRVQAAHDALEPALHTALAESGCALREEAIPLLDAAINRGADRIAHGAASRETTLAALQVMAHALALPSA